ncbi:Acetyl-/propionyl-coenzyme A carboxylase alpha chain [Rhodobacteraceae bacterium SB2]|jgi:3-methylcrotonyl-CoA carboxylase alpha subunit|nr:biotin/lipoyl-binding protein [Paracoccaceae bacterium]MBT4952929.1 biotin/lipoyl-binding protein [Paracoccaceae bacterium]MBT5473647.1 biotin/lipoyl-binding protein [Paracoccaceae bacterium]OAH06268.1 Acetyl-/propionyl-coenzyme A carboxylase alpha chain [Rhodobacteraceae bacterium SB2]HBY12284.1 ATP-grasp domain-containing protein [Paracoccaceae bacterium]|tara:strand:- start:8603 stop:10537 length:1935 start_codon:yes stop_codon:yes gene_type:complete
MFEGILIANRGEIALRVMRSAQRMGVRCIAVYSDADQNAQHVLQADHAVHIGGALPAQSYLCGDKIIAAALSSGAQAIHPGYGFLSENPEFVEAVEAAGLVFIGPSASAIRAMGLKDSAKALMAKAGVPVVPGFSGHQDPARLLKEAEKIGFPVLIKAVAGGGGKGMRLVDTADAFAAALSEARSEAVNAFGNGDVLLEKFISQPRHIEVQVFGDGTDVLHLFERDCSLQRRHQKVVEEAPAPGMTKQMRAVMGKAAVAAAKAIEYRGAGTVEFIVDGSDGLREDRFWFMEMNTRLQVEHPVTEAITGVDLVEWQLNVAAGGKLPMQQKDLKITGHAIEARLYAEDPQQDFLPMAGQLTHLAFPSACRIDSGVIANDMISAFYDPMLAKVIVFGQNRRAAIDKMGQSLAAIEIAGIKTNLGFLAALTQISDFTSCRLDTGLISRNSSVLTAPVKLTARALLAGVVCAVGNQATKSRLSGFCLWKGASQRVQVIFEGQQIVLPVQLIENQIILKWQGADYPAVYSDAGWQFEGEALPAAHRAGRDITVFDQGGIALKLIDPLSRAEVAAVGTTQIEAPMPGLVIAVSVSAGQEVEEGQPLITLEAMKMQQVLSAPFSARVDEIAVQEGAYVEAQALLIQLKNDQN